MTHGFKPESRLHKEEAERIVKTAAKLILSDIRSTNFETSAYPTHEEIENMDKIAVVTPVSQNINAEFDRAFVEADKHWPSYRSSVAREIFSSCNFVWINGRVRPRFWFKVVN